MCCYVSSPDLMVGCGAVALKRLLRWIEVITSVTACLITATLTFECLNYVVVQGLIAEPFTSTPLRWLLQLWLEAPRLSVEFLYELIRFLYQFENSLLENKHKQAKTQHHDIIICYKTKPLFNSQTEEKITVCLSSCLLNLLCRNIHLCSFVSRHSLFNCVNTELQLIDVAPHDRALSPHIIYHVLYIPPLLWNLTDRLDQEAVILVAETAPLQQRITVQIAFNVHSEITKWAERLSYSRWMWPYGRIQDPDVIKFRFHINDTAAQRRYYY